MAGKKRKLPKDLKDASAMAVHYLNATKKISDACQVLRSLTMQDVHTMDLSPDDAVLFLIAQYGIQHVSKVCSALSTLPEVLPLSQKESMIQSITGRDDTGFITNFIRKYTPGLPSTLLHSDSPTALAPPTAVCFECHNSLVFNHQCNVTLYTLYGVTSAYKVTLRCCSCSLSYNYSMWGRKRSTGFKYYPLQREYVEVSDTVFYQRRLLELQCSLANHAWVSYQGFAESFNDTFTIAKEEELSPKNAADAFWNGELENEVRTLSQENALTLDEAVFYTDSDREKIMDKVESLRSCSIYPHINCSSECKERGCGHLWVTDGIWKLTFPHCMHRVKYIVEQIPTLSLPDVCTVAPVYGKAFCAQHCEVMEKHCPPIPTDIRGFLRFCGVLSNEETSSGEDPRVADTDQDELIQKVLDMTAVPGIGQSAAKSQGTGDIIAATSSMVDKDEDTTDSEEKCKKNTGEPKRLRRWSRGHQFIVRAGGHIESWQPLYKSESPSQVFFIILQWLQALTTSGSITTDQLDKLYLAYDNMCNVCRLKVAKNRLPLPAPMDQAWLKLRKIIDTFHLKNHTNPLCHTEYSPQKMKDENPFFNTQAGEQTFVWMGKFKNIVCAMGKTHHLFYLHRMVRRRNRYTDKCYTYGRKPILPKAKNRDNSSY